MLTYTNPRMLAEFDDWPSGGRRVKCRFEIELNKKGERCLRTTSTVDTSSSFIPTWNKPRMTTYSVMCRIVDGSDGKTYVAKYDDLYGMRITVVDSALKFDVESVSRGVDTVERFEDLYLLFS